MHVTVWFFHANVTDYKAGFRILGWVQGPSAFRRPWTPLTLWWNLWNPAQYFFKLHKIKINRITKRINHLQCNYQNNQLWVFWDSDICAFWRCKSLSHVWHFVTPWTIQSMEFSRPRMLEWVAVPFSRGSSQTGIKPRCLPLHMDSLSTELSGKPNVLPNA